jgi:RNA polymerase sigma-70 factor (ECF subfamily)
VRAVLAGDHDSYAVLVSRYKDALYRYAERMTGHIDEAEDIVQQAFINGFKNLDRCRNPERIGGWLFRIAVNLCKDQLKGRAKREVSLEVAGPLQASERLPEAGAERAEMRGKIYRALQSLSNEHREAFLLKHVEGWSYEEMAEKLEISVSALKMRVHRARGHLQDMLEIYR